MIKKHSMKESVFLRLVITFLLAIIPIVLLGVWIYDWSVRTVKDEIMDSATARVSFYLKQLEEEIEHIKILQYDCLNDEYLNKLAIRYVIMDQYEYVESMRRLQQRLATIQNSSTYISNVNAHILPIEKTISPVTSVDAIDMDRFEKIRVPSGQKGAQLVEYGGTLHLTTGHEWPITMTKLFMIEITLDTTAFESALKSFTTDMDSGSLLVDLSNGMVFSSEQDTIRISTASGTYTAQSANSDAAVLDISEKDDYIVEVKSDYLNMLYLYYIPHDLIFTPVQGFYVWIWVYALAAFIIITFYYLYTYRLIHKPLENLVKAFEQVENGRFDVSVSMGHKNEFSYLYKGFNTMVRNLSVLIDQVYKQKILMQRSELKQLQSQIKPHFLYNSFFLINTMATVGDENLIPFTKQLGEYFRFITRNASDFIPLKQEVAHARSYTEIQSMRFSRRLQLIFEDYPQELKDMLVPRLMIQPVIENAFEHAVEKTNRKGIVAIRFERYSEYLAVTVEDNGQSLSQEALEGLRLSLVLDENVTDEVTGLVNIHRRIALLSDEKYGLDLERSELGGLKVVLKLGMKGDAEDVSIADRG